MKKNIHPSKALFTIIALFMLAGVFGAGYWSKSNPSLSQNSPNSVIDVFEESAGVTAPDPDGPAAVADMVQYDGGDFSILYPRFVTSSTWFGSGEKVTYAPLKPFEYKLDQEVKPTSVTSFIMGDSDKPTPAPQRLEDLRGISWQIVVQHDVMNEADIDAFIKARYAPGCKAVIKDVQADGTQRVGIMPVSGERTDPESGCWVNYMTDVIYDPVWHRIFQWDMGQAPTFTKHTSGGYNFNTFDPLMKASFKIIPIK